MSANAPVPTGPKSSAVTTDVRVQATAIIPSNHNSNNGSNTDLNPSHIDIAKESDIFQAVFNRDLKKLTELVTTENVDTANNRFGITALHLSAAMGGEAIFDFLMSKGANINAQVQVPPHAIEESIFIYILTEDKYKEGYFFYHNDIAVILALRYGGLKGFKTIVEKYNVDLQKLNANDSATFALLKNGNNFETIHYALGKMANTNEERRIIVEKRDPEGQNLFLRSTSVNFIKYCIETLKVDFFQQDSDGNTILHNQDSLEALKYLFEDSPLSKEERERLLNIQNNENETPLLAYISGADPWDLDIEIIQYYIENLKVSPHQKYFDGSTLLHIASKLHVKIVKYLLEVYAKTENEKKALLDARDNEGNTPFLLSSVNPFTLDICTYYINDIGVDILQTNSRGKTILHLVEEGGSNKKPYVYDATIVEYLLEIYPTTKEKQEKVQALLEKQDDSGNPPFLNAAKKKVTPVNLMKRFLKTDKVKVNQKNAEQQTIVHLACDRDDLNDEERQLSVLNILKYLLEELTISTELRKELIEAHPPHLPSPFFLVASHGYLSLLRYFVEDLKMNINQKDEYGRTALSMSIRFGRISTTRYLLGLGARSDTVYMRHTDPNKTYDPKFLEILNAAAELWNLSMFAFASASTRTLKQLLEAGASFNQKNSLGQTPLFFVAGKGNVKQFNEFLEHGADPLVKDDEQFTAVMRAEQSGQMLIVASYLIRDLKNYLLPFLINKEEIEKNKQTIKDKVKNIFTAAKKTQDLKKQAELFFGLGQQFKELQLIDEATLAFQSISEIFNDLFRLARGELAELVKPIIPEEVENAWVRETRILNQIKLLAEAGLESESIHPKDQIMLRTRLLNELYGISGFSKAAATTAAAAPATPYSDFCTPAGAMGLIQRHRETLKQNNSLSQEIKTLKAELTESHNKVKTLSNSLTEANAKATGRNEALQEILQTMRTSTKRPNRKRKELAPAMPPASAAASSNSAATAAAAAATMAATRTSNSTELRFSSPSGQTPVVQNEGEESSAPAQAAKQPKISQKRT